MKNLIPKKFRRLFVRQRTYNAAAARAASHVPGADEDGDGTRLSGAFLIVLVLHVIAVMGVFAFARIRDARKDATATGSTTQTPAPKNSPPKPAAAKPEAAKPPVAAVAAPVAAVSPTPAPHESPTPAAATSHPGRKTHVVKEGETLTKIAIAYSVSVPDLVSTNKLKKQDAIHAGQTLMIPSPKVADKTPAPPSRKTSKTYVVRKGDSALKIARTHGCTYEELIKLNKIKDPQKIQTGMVLKLPPKND